MRILLDSNAVIDFFEGREPFFEESARVIEQVQQGVATGLLCATTLKTIAYLAGKTLGKRQAVDQVRQCCPYLRRFWPATTRPSSPAPMFLWTATC